MQYDICHPYILTEMKSRIIFQNGFQTDEEAIISNLKEQFLEMFTEHTSDIIKQTYFYNQFVTPFCLIRGQK